MARLQIAPAIAQSVPVPIKVKARGDYCAPPWPRGLLPAGLEELMPVTLAEPSWLSKPAAGAQQTRLARRATQTAQTTSYMKPAVVISADLEAARGTALSGGGLSGCTTVRLKNVEPSLMPDSAIAALNANGYEGMFDFVHVPMDMKRRKNRGILFINFVEPTTAEEMYQSFHHQTMPGVSLPSKALEITPAYVQGFQENFDRHVEAEAPFLECFRCVL